MGPFLKLLRYLLPIAKAGAATTPNKIDDAVIVLIEELLAKLDPVTEDVALDIVKELRAKL